MPTPSSHGPPDPPSPHHNQPFSFSSTCPEELGADAADNSVIAAARPPLSPSSWHPHPPPPYSAEAPRVELPGDDPAERSDTMSPQPQSSSDGPSEEPTSSPASRDDIDDEHNKQGDMDEDVAGFEPMDVEGEGTSALVPGQHRDSTGMAAKGSHDGSISRTRARQHRQSDQIPPPGADDDVSVVEHGSEWDDQPSRGWEFPILRIIPTTPSSFLRPGGRFHGTQQSERQVYDVQVEIKHADMRESFLCGYLRIQGLTEDHPTLTTYFEGEIIGPKYGFITKHASWGANEKIDLSHWGKFTAFRPFAKQARKNASSGSSGGVTGLSPRDVAQCENIFMRWKEHFLVPDHRVRTINGASFEGFYYICFNQVRGEVNGIYFHSKSEKFQQLELKHVENRGCLASMEFR